MPSDAIFGLIGVIIGGTLTGGVDLVLEQRRERRRGKAAARLLHSGLRDINDFLEASVDDGEWRDDPAEVLEVQLWTEQRSVLAGAPGFMDWNLVSSAWAFVAKLRREVRLAMEGPGDDPLANRSQEFLQLGMAVISTTLTGLEEYAKLVPLPVEVQVSD